MPAATPSNLSFTFRWVGIPVTIRASFLLVAFVMGSRRDSPVLVVEWLAVSFVSVLVHELGHAFAARAFGGEPHIELHTMGGSAYANPRAPFTAWQSIAVSLAGPGAGVALGALVLAARLFVGAPASPLAHAIFADLLWVNWGYGLLNLLPILPLDGGHVMSTAIDAVRGRPSPTLAAAVSLVVAALLAALAVAFGLNGVLFILAWIAVSHVGALLSWWRTRRELALEPDFAALDEALVANDLPRAGALAEALRRRVHTPQRTARVLSSLASIHLLEGNTELAVEALEAVPAGWRVDATMESQVWAKAGQPGRAVDGLRRRLAEAHDPALLSPLVFALLAAGDFSGAKECALGDPAAVGREAMFAVVYRLHFSLRFKESVTVSTTAFEHFGVANDAYNVGCGLARLGRPDEAMQWLERAFAAGYTDRAGLAADDDYVSLRERDDFRALCAAPVS